MSEILQEYDILTVSKTETLDLWQKTPSLGMRQGAILFWIFNKIEQIHNLREEAGDFFFSLFGEIHMRQGGDS